MDVTAHARSLFGPVPAHREFGIKVIRAVDGVGVVALEVRPWMTNVVGSLHSSGLAALVDAAGLAALIAACDDEERFAGVVPLGAQADLQFLAPARGRLVACCRLDDGARAAVQELLGGREERVRITTAAEVTDAAGTVACRGRFVWSLRRAVPTS